MNQEANQLLPRKTHRLNLDSDQEQERKQQERKQQQQYDRLMQEKRKRKQQKQKAKQQKQRMQKQQAERKVQERKQEVEKYNSTAILFEPDSNSGVSFTRLKRKIEHMFPKTAKKKIKQESSQEEQGQSEEESGSQSQESSEQESNSQSQQESAPKKKKKASKKSQKRRRQREQSDSQQGQQRKNKNKSTVKVQQQMSGKDKLVQQVAIRWSYALPEWPPKDYDYIEELKKKGYRAVQFAKFKFVDQVVDGLVKVYQLDGYQGVYRSKNALIDVRPKGECPSLNYFYSKSQQQLNQLLKRALAKQIQQLQQLQFKQSGQQKLLQDLKRRNRELVR